jgi:hypothetical protein
MDSAEVVAERRWEETLLGRTFPSVADVSAACKGIPVPLALKAAWLMHGFGTFEGDEADVFIRILSPCEVRDLYAGNPWPTGGKTPFLLRDVMQREAHTTVTKGGVVCSPTGKRLGNIDRFLEKLTHTPAHLRANAR